MPAGVRVVAEEHLENRPGRANQVARVPRVINEDAVEGEGNRVARRRCSGWQVIGAHKHPGRADRERIERLGFGGKGPLAGRQPKVEPAKCDAHRVRNEGFAETRHCIELAFKLLHVVVFGIDIEFLEVVDMKPKNPGRCLIDDRSLCSQIRLQRL
ncbi:MAG TPA: hypothetical protein PLL76_22360 [Thermoanaerobaculia bacterium]|nr:hypothetical protein [Thermoanaerobaculia bacterium]